jgi:4-amino-4-deoxy-L-arabinose transferase-like glycosyltransferase
MQYYVKYPALTILFYPPLFYLISAPFYAIFGVSHATALAIVLVHYFALAVGLYFIARLWLDWVSSLAIGLAALGAPAIALWGRQVMLEVR